MIKTKIKFYVWTIFCFVFVAKQLVGNSSTILTGFIDSSSNGERLVGATVYNINQQKGTISNKYGFYALSCKEGDSIQFSFIGYEKYLYLVDVDQDQLLFNVSLETNNEIEEVNIKYKEYDEIQCGGNNILMESLDKMPSFLSVPDVFKTIQQLPGIQGGTEGTSSFYVRGGDVGQNLILIDDVPVYNANHLFGFFSVINADAIKTCNVYKGWYPAKYGGRASSVIDLILYDGNSKYLTGGYEIGTMLGKFNIEGPINDESSFSFAARRSFIDLFSQPISLIANNGGMGYYFGDFNGKINYRLNKRNRLILNCYYGKDKGTISSRIREEGYSFNSKNYLTWGNKIASLRWNNLLSQKTFVNTTFYYSAYTYETGQNHNNIEEGLDEFSNYQYNTNIDDFGVRCDLEMMINDKIDVDFGGTIVNHQFNVGTAHYESSNNYTEDIDIESDSTKNNQSGIESSLYVSAKINLLSVVNVSLGTNVSGFIYDQNFSYALDPRCIANIRLNKAYSISGAYSIATQYIHLLNNNSLGMPTDYWIPTQKHLVPEKSSQFSIGLNADYTNYQFSIEAYYKVMNGLITYTDGTSFTQSINNQIDEITCGNGISKGLELYLEKKYGSLTGSGSYTLSKTDRTFENVNYGESYSFAYDRRHNLSFSFKKTFNKQLSLSATWQYMSGFYMTLPVSEYPVLEDLNKYESNNYLIDFIPVRNNFQTPAYHRLDLALILSKVKSRGIRTWNLGLYNAYSRRNPFYVMVEGINYNDKTRKYENSRLIQKSLFPIIPSVSYSFNFN